MTICRKKATDIAIKTAALGILFAVCALSLQVFAQQTASADSEAQLTADEIVQKLIEHNQQRAWKLQHYSGTRHYHLEYHGLLGARDASMDVEASFDAPSTKNFRVISETGSKIFISRVLRKLLESEKEAMDENNRRQTALTPENYIFQLAAKDGATDETCYVLQVEPRTENKFLYRGRIWIDIHDFAVARIEAEPARNPSFWTKKTEIHQQYAKVGEFWLPAQNRTVTAVRLGGVATLQIDYSGYEIAARQTRPQNSATLRWQDDPQHHTASDATLAAPLPFHDANPRNLLVGPPGHN